MARHKEFDQNQVLDRAIEVFWKNGYEATSIQDLVENMGISRGSLYGTFDSKHGLFLAALDRYDHVVIAEALAILDRPGSALENIRRFFGNLIRDCRSGGRHLGCLVTNSAVELSTHDRDTAIKVAGCLLETEGAFYRALVRAQADGELPESANLRALARFFTSSLQGLKVIAKAPLDRRVLQDVVDTILLVVDH